MGLGGKTRSLLTKEQHAVFRQCGPLEWCRSRQVVNPNDGEVLRRGPGDKVSDGWVMPNVLVHVGHHGASAVPLSSADDVDFGGEEGVGGSDHGADVAVVFPVFDGHVELMTLRVKVSHDGIHPPIAVAVEDVAPVTVLEKFRIEPRIVGPWLPVRPYPNGRCWFVAHETG